MTTNARLSKGTQRTVQLLFSCWSKDVILMLFALPEPWSLADLVLTYSLNTAKITQVMSYSKSKFWECFAAT
jgi:hypothetical protein